METTPSWLRPKPLFVEERLEVRPYFRRLKTFDGSNRRMRLDYRKASRAMFLSVGSFMGAYLCLMMPAGGGVQQPRQDTIRQESVGGRPQTR